MKGLPSKTTVLDRFFDAPRDSAPKLELQYLLASGVVFDTGAVSSLIDLIGD